MPQLRQNPITGDWVVIAPERAKRPSDFVQPVEAIYPESHASCTFCSGGAAHAERIVELDGKSTYVTPNKFPAFLNDPATASPRTFMTEHEFFRARPAVGGNDIIVINDPNETIMTFTNHIWLELLDTFSERIMYYAQQNGVQSIMPIYNHRSAAGASQRHPHAQLFATDIIPPLLSRELHGSFKNFERSGTCSFCELVKHERAFKSRIVAENDTFVAFTFYASRFPFETWVVPKQHSDRFEGVDQSLRADLAGLLPQLFARFNQTLHDPPLNIWIHTLPTVLDGSEYFHWHIEIAPRLATYGGFELGSGTIIDIVSPEHAAAFHRGDIAASTVDDQALHS